MKYMQKCPTLNSKLTTKVASSEELVTCARELEIVAIRRRLTNNLRELVHMLKVKIFFPV